VQMSPESSLMNTQIYVEPLDPMEPLGSNP
jgi:hypothetical protein